MPAEPPVHLGAKPEPTATAFLSEAALRDLRVAANLDRAPATSIETRSS